MKNMRNKFLNANEAYQLCNARLNYEGVDFDNTKALFNVGFTIEDPLDNHYYKKERKWIS